MAVPQGFQMLIGYPGCRRPLGNSWQEPGLRMMRWRQQHQNRQALASGGPGDPPSGQTAVRHKFRGRMRVQDRLAGAHRSKSWSTMSA